MVQRRPIRRSLDSRCTHTSTVMWRFLLLEHKIECFLKSDTLVRRPMTFVNEKRQWLILTRVWCELFWCPTVPILLLLWCLHHLINVFTTFTTQYGHTSLGMCTLFVTLAAKQKTRHMQQISPYQRLGSCASPQHTWAETGTTWGLQSSNHTFVTRVVFHTVTTNLTVAVRCGRWLPMSSLNTMLPNAIHASSLWQHSQLDVWARTHHSWK